MKRLETVKMGALRDASTRREYHGLQEEFDLIDQLITMRTSAGLTQEDVANTLGTDKGNISRLEGGKANPSWSTIKKYAAACGFRVKLEVVVGE